MADIYDRLNQDKVWRGASGHDVALTDMTPRHRRNLLAWLRRNADSLKFQQELRAVSGPGPRGDAACDAFEAGLSQLLEQSAAEWLAEWPLVERLEQLVTEDEGRSAADGRHL